MSTLSVRVPDELGEQLEKLAQATGRTRPFLAVDALRRYLSQEEWLSSALQRAVNGTAKYADHATVDEWLRDWGKAAERDAPECK